MVRFHPHARDRMAERGATEVEITMTAVQGERFPVQFKRQGFRLTFPFNAEWRDKFYSSKRIEAYCVYDTDDWLVITAL